MSRVLFLSYHLPTPEEAGAGRPWAEATLLRESGHDVTVLTAGTHYLSGESNRRGKGLWSEETRDGLRIIKTWAPSGFRKSMARRLLNYAAYAGLALLKGLALRADYVFMGTDPLFIIPVGFLIARLRKARLVLDERDLFPDTAIALGYMHPGFATNLLEKWHNLVRRSAWHIIAATPGIKRMLVEKGIAGDKVTVMVNAFPPPALFTAEGTEPSARRAEAPKAGPPAPSDTLADLGSGFVALYGGGMGLANELMTVIRAAAHLQAEGIPVTFLFVGEGDRKKEYIAYCQENKISNCRFLSALPRSAMSSVLARADVCIHSLQANPFWRCALSSKVFDYLAYGKPLVFAGEGDIVDLIHASGGGIAVPPENPEAFAAAIRRLYNDPELRRRMGVSAREYIKDHFSRDVQRSLLAQCFAI